MEFAPDTAYFRAVTIAASAHLVFRWLGQLRIAPYSYDLIDNFGRRSPPQLPERPRDLASGQRIMSIFRLTAFESDRSLSLRLASRSYAAAFGDVAGSYRIDPLVTADPDRPSVRLVAKILVRYPRGAHGRAIAAVLPMLDLVMFRKQLLTLKRYAERDARAYRARCAPPAGRAPRAPGA